MTRLTLDLDTLQVQSFTADAGSPAVQAPAMASGHTCYRTCLNTCWC